MTRLVIVRHGNTFEAGEPPRRIGARTDLPLTAQGYAQAEALGQHFAANGVRFDRALSSPLARTRATAEAILAHQPDPPPLKNAPFLTEIDHGPDEGQTEDKVLARIGNAGITLWETECLPPEGWEAGGEWRVPAWQAFAAEVWSAVPGGTVLLATSSGAARFAPLAFGLGRDLAPGWTKLRTGSYGLIEIGGAASFRLVGWDTRPGGTTGDTGLF